MTINDIITENSILTEKYDKEAYDIGEYIIDNYPESMLGKKLYIGNLFGTNRKNVFFHSYKDEEDRKRYYARRVYGKLS